MRKWVELLLGILDSGVLSLNMKKLSEAGAWQCLREFLLLNCLPHFLLYFVPLNVPLYENCVVCAFFANIVYKIIDNIV